MTKVACGLLLACLALGCGDDDGNAGASGGGTGGMGGSGGGGASATCAQLCALVATAQCPNDGACMQDCLTLWDYPGCQAPARAMVECGVSVPASQWACDSFGEAEPTGGQCATELSALGACLGGS